jgi:hypothetical protein
MLPRNIRHRVLAIIGTLCDFLLAVGAPVSYVASFASAQMPTPSPSAPLEATCQQVLEQARQLTEANCKDTGRNQACYGNVKVNRDLRTEDGAPPNRFEQSGDILGLRYLTRIQTAPLNPDDGSWGMAIMKLQANLPDTNPGQNVTLVLFGDTDLRPEGDENHSFYLSTGLGRLSCKRLPESGVIVRAPAKLRVTFTVNGVQIKIASTALLRHDGTHMLIRNLEGKVEAVSKGVSQALASGQELDVPMTGTQASGPPSKPRPAPFEAALDEVVEMAISIDGDNAAFSGPITLTGNVEAVSPAVPALALGGYAVHVGSAAGASSVRVGDQVRVVGVFRAYYVVAQSITILRRASIPSSRSNATPTPTASDTPPPQPTALVVPSNTSSPSATPTPTFTMTPTPTLTATTTPHASSLGTDTATPSPFPTATQTSTATDVPTETPTVSPSVTPTVSPSATVMPTFTDTPTPEPTDTAQPTETLEPTKTIAPSDTPMPTDTPKPTKEPREPTDTPPPTATPKLGAGEVRLTSMCSDDPAAYRNWRVTSTFETDVIVEWELYGGAQRGALSVPAMGEASFRTQTEAGANTVRLFHEGRLVDVKASDPQPCAAGSGADGAASPTPAAGQPTYEPTSAATAWPTDESPAPTVTSPVGNMGG